MKQTAKYAPRKISDKTSEKMFLFRSLDVINAITPPRMHDSTEGKSGRRKPQMI